MRFSAPVTRETIPVIRCSFSSASLAGRSSSGAGMNVGGGSRPKKSVTGTFSRDAKTSAARREILVRPVSRRLMKPLEKSGPANWAWVMPRSARFFRISSPTRGSIGPLAFCRTTLFGVGKVAPFLPSE